MFKKKASPGFFSDPALIADEIVTRVGKKIVLAMPLGLGKANHIVDALVAKALKDSSLELRIFTALTLERPKPKSELERRFLNPALDRLFGRYPEFSYTALRHKNALPANIQVNEFFFQAGLFLGSPQAQQEYIAANYTHVLGVVLAHGTNVIAQLISPPEKGDAYYSLSCNPDIAADLVKARTQGRAKFIFAGQVNGELPFMAGEALIPASEIDLVLEGPDTEFELFSAPRRPVSFSEQAIGLHAARLVRDGGTLQIGIGSIGDAVTKALLLRHNKNDAFRQVTGALGCRQSPGLCHDEAFTAGLYGLSEMFVDGFLQLARGGVLKRKVDGALLHAGFFLDSRAFYRELREMKDAERALFQMKPVSFTNALYGDEDRKRAARVKASFINTAMMATLQGAVISDALDDTSVVSGVGGQYNFAEQAFALEDARFIITLNATRSGHGEVLSNILWTYGHETVPWHLRDIIITEYGIADLRGKANAEVIAAMLSITDSRFQEPLLQQAKNAGKIDSCYQIPEEFGNNTPARVEKALKAARKEGLLPEFPFGTDFTPIEQRLIPALELLKQSTYSPLKLVELLAAGTKAGRASGKIAECIERMGLTRAATAKEHVYQKLLQGALAATES